MSKKLNCRSFDSIARATRGFSCRLSDVDPLLIRYVSERGFPVWMTDKAKLPDLERYNKAVLEDTSNIIEVSGWNKIALQMLQFVMEDCVGEWAITTVWSGSTPTYYFHFTDETDFLMTRLSV